MDVKECLTRGLESKQKYLPVWYQYDKEGSTFYYRCLKECKYYYFRKSEMSILAEKVAEIVNRVPEPRVLVEMGSGNSEKSRMFIEAILNMQRDLKYVPVDISEEFLLEASEAISKEYGDRVKVEPIAGDYNVGIDKLSNIEGNKLVIWVGGGFQNQPYAEQVGRIGRISQVFSDKDRLLLSLDVTQNAEEIEKAYLCEISTPMYLNAIWRLNREYDSCIDTDKFELESKFVKDKNSDGVGYVILRARSKVEQTYNIPGLGITVTFKEGEFLHLHEGEGVSCKYTQEQIQTIAFKGHQILDRMWVAGDNHVALCCLAKPTIES